MSDFLPVCKEDMKKRGWDEVDFVYVCGDAYVDHSSFGAAIITRVLESRGYKIGFIAQPDWKDDNSICVFGRPRLGFIVSAGNMDSMVKDAVSLCRIANNPSLRRSPVHGGKSNR